MGVPDIIALSIVALALFGAVFYILRSKKAGKKCIGCPYSGSCSLCSCASYDKEKDPIEDEKSDVE